MNEQRRLLVVSGPSGAGKDTVVKYLMEAHPEIEISVSATTRAMRPGEAEGVNYYYMTNAQFEEKLARGEILEHVNYCGKYYGTPKSEVDRRIAAGTTVVLVIEVVGAANIKRMYPESTLVFILPPSMEELAARLRGMRCHVNLIPANPVKENGYKRPDARRVEHFSALLNTLGINTTVRRTLGADIDASCGQLRRKYTASGRAPEEGAQP